MTDGNQPLTFDRRTLLIGAGAAVFAAACSRSDEADSTQGQSPVADDGDRESDTGASDTGESGDADDTAVADNDEAGGSADAGLAESSEPAALTPEMFGALSVCTLLPSSTAGPFPTTEQLERRDITEGYPGHPLRLGIRVVDDRCEPVPGAQVEIWHTDATGDYSAYDDRGSGKDEGEGTTFCRGYQTADTDGILEFQTIYPGWYEGRAVHIHVRARLEGQELLTAQLYFDEDYTESVMATGEYAQFGPPNTSWAADRIIGNPASDGTGIALAAAPTSLGPGTLGLVNLGVSV